MTRQPAPRLCRYKVFGLTVDSEFDLPELGATRATGAADVTIVLGRAPATLDGGQPAGPGIVARPGVLLMESPPARFLVRDGREILVEPRPGAEARDIRLYLTGSAFGALCHQRGLLPLHANAVVLDGRAYAFAGDSGAGKSTLAAWFERRGLRVLCDDVCAITFDDAGRPLAWPGVARIKLWSDALEALGLGSEGLEPIFEGKFSRRGLGRGPSSAVPLARVLTLGVAEVGAPVQFAALTGVAAVKAIIGNIYRWPFAAPLCVAQAQLDRAVVLARAASVTAVERTWGFDAFADAAAAIETEMRHAAGADAASRAHSQRK